MLERKHRALSSTLVRYCLIAKLSLQGFPFENVARIGRVSMCLTSMSRPYILSVLIHETCVMCLEVLMCSNSTSDLVELQLIGQ